MIILNTTFILHKSVAPDVIDWVKRSYVESSRRVALDGYEPIVTKVMSNPDPECVSIAAHIYFGSLESAQKWDDGVADRLRGIMRNRWGEKALTFQTYLEVLQ